MGTPRNLAARLLREVLRLAPDESRDWALAMLRELDFIEGDWAALSWALGSAAAILRHEASGWQARLRRQTDKGAGMNNTGKKAIALGLGVLSALALVGCAFAVLRIIGILIPGLEHSPRAYWLAVLAIPEAAGIMATGLVMALHVAVQLTLHW
jgi:hypothetical protein